MAGQFGSVGAAFNQGMENVLFEQAKADHEREKQRIEAEREARQAQAQMDAHIEHQQNLLEHQHEFEEKAHDAKVKRWFQQNGNMQRGDRPSPEQESSARELGINVFRQAPAAVSTQPMQPPAALMEAPPAGAPAEGAPAPEPMNATGQGPLAAPQPFYPGTLAEQQKADKEERVKALIAKASALSDHPSKAEVIPIAMEAHELGVPVDALLKSGATAAGAKAQVFYDAKTRTATDMLGNPVTQADIDANPNMQVHVITPATEGAVSASSLLTDARAREQMALTQADKGIVQIDKATNSAEQMIEKGTKMLQTLGAGNTIADATLATQAVTMIEAGRNSGVRTTDTKINAIQNGSLHTGETLAKAMERFFGTPADKQAQFVFTAQQKADLKAIAETLMGEARTIKAKGVKWRRAITTDRKDVDKVLKHADDAQADIYGTDSEEKQAPTAKKKVFNPATGKLELK